MASGVNPRELTTEEKRGVSEAWDVYLDESSSSSFNDPSCLPREANAWEKYQQYLENAGVIKTLAGYRKQLTKEVKPMSKQNPCSCSTCPAFFASVTPLLDKSISVQPVNLFSLFQILSPCLSNASFIIVVSPELKIVSIVA